MQQQVPDELSAVSIASGRPLDGRLGPAIEMNKHTYLGSQDGSEALVRMNGRTDSARSNVAPVVEHADDRDRPSGRPQT